MILLLVAGVTTHETAGGNERAQRPRVDVVAIDVRRAIDLTGSIAGFFGPGLCGKPGQLAIQKNETLPRVSRDEFPRIFRCAAGESDPLECTAAPNGPGNAIGGIMRNRAEIDFVVTSGDAVVHHHAVPELISQLQTSMSALDSSISVVWPITVSPQSRSVEPGRQ